MSATTGEVMSPRDRLRAELAARGVAVMRGDAPELSADEAARSPWAFAERVLGERPVLVERQPIKAVPGGRSFASSAADTPLHTDSQMFAGVPPSVQILVCARPADRAGACLFADGWALLDRVKAGDPVLYRQMFESQRRIPFVFGDVFGPTVSLRAGRLVITHSPMPPRDALGARILPWIHDEPCSSIALGAREILVADNHRMLHGRTAFEGPRELVRLLVWMDSVVATNEGHQGAAEEIAVRTVEALNGARDAEMRRLGLGEAPSYTGRSRLAVVLEMLRGVPPGVLAARERIPEPELYRMRDAALAAAERALGGDVPAGDEAMAALLVRLSQR